MAEERLAASVPSFYEVPPRLLVHRKVHQIACDLQRMQRCAFIVDGESLDPVVSHLPKSLSGACEPTLLAMMFASMASGLHASVELWIANEREGNLVREGTSLEHDFRQGARPGNTRIGPVGSPSCHGAVLVFACWIRDEVRKHHTAEGRSETAPVRTDDVRRAWTSAAASMGPGELDPAVWDLVRQELDAEYSRLLPMPRPNQHVYEASNWRPGDVRAAIYHVLAQARSDGLNGWTTVAEKVAPFHGAAPPDAAHVRRIGAEMKKSGHVRTKPDAPRFLVLTEDGMATYRRLRKQ